MRRLRTSYQEDWEDLEATDHLRVRIFGLSVHPVAALVAMACVVVMFMVLFYVGQMGWLPDSTAIRWTITIVSIVVMLATAVVCVMCCWVLAKSIRDSRMRLAKLDGATDDEARQESQRFIRRNVYLRLAVYVAMGVAVWIVLGSPFVFPWAGPGPYLGGLAVLVGGIILFTSARAGRLGPPLRRFLGRRQGR